MALSAFSAAPSLRAAKLLQSCPTLCDPMDHSPPGSSGHRILQAGILEWVAMPSSRRSSLGQEDPLRKEMETHSNILAWEIPQTEEPGRL